MIEAVNKVAKTRKRAAVSGPQFLGLSHPAVAQEIAKLPGHADVVAKCSSSSASAAAAAQVPPCGGGGGRGGGGGGSRSAS